MKPITDPTLLYFGFWGACAILGIVAWWRLHASLARIENLLSRL